MEAEADKVCGKEDKEEIKCLFQYPAPDDWMPRIGDSVAVRFKTAPGFVLGWGIITGQGETPFNGELFQVPYNSGFVTVTKEEMRPYRIIATIEESNA